MKTLNLKVTESLGIFLQSKRADHCGRDLIDYYLDQPGLEIQVNVARGDGYPVPGKPHRFTDGINEWGPFHIPRNAATKPSFREWRLPWPLELHASAVGSTGWDWKTGQSRYSGFDFDTIVGHAQGVGISQESLDAVREAAKKLPYVSGRRSTGGAGLHLYVHFAEPIPTENHTIHAELARLVLDKMSRDIGFQFLDFADAVGGALS